MAFEFYRKAGRAGERRIGRHDAEGRRALIRLAALLLFCLFLLPASAQALTVQGNQFMEGDQPVILRGIAMGDVTDLPNDVDPYPEIAKDWHANVVRLSIHPGTWRDKKDEAASILKRHVDMARAAGLYVIIDYHVIGFPDGYALDYFDITDPTTKTDYYETRFTLAMDFWMTVALNHTDTGILFELWNEPSSNTEEEEGGDLAYWKKYRPYWRVLTDAIRASGNKNVVLVAPPLWAFNLRGLGNRCCRTSRPAMSGTSIPATIPTSWSTPSMTSTRRSRSSSPNGASSPTPSSTGPAPPRNTARRSPISWMRAACHRPPGAGTPTTAPACASPSGKLTVWGQFAQDYLKKHAVGQ